MRTQEQVVDRIEERKQSDPFGFEVQEYMLALDVDHIGPYLKDDAEADGWEPAFASNEDVRERMVDYMEFAWEKAINCRGISAGRSIAHYRAWLWLIGDEELWPTLDDYEYYGKNELRRICEFLDLDPDEYDDGIRVNNEAEYAAVMRSRRKQESLATGEQQGGQP